MYHRSRVGPSRQTVRYSTSLDVLVDAKHVMWIVAGLDPAESLVIVTVGGAHAFLPLVQVVLP